MNLCPRSPRSGRDNSADQILVGRRQVSFLGQAAQTPQTELRSASRPALIAGFGATNTAAAAVRSIKSQFFYKEGKPHFAVSAHRILRFGKPHFAVSGFHRAPPVLPPADRDQSVGFSRVRKDRWTVSTLDVSVLAPKSSVPEVALPRAPVPVVEQLRQRVNWFCRGKTYLSARISLATIKKTYVPCGRTPWGLRSIVFHWDSCDCRAALITRPKTFYGGCSCFARKLHRSSTLSTATNRKLELIAQHGDLDLLVVGELPARPLDLQQEVAVAPMQAGVIRRAFGDAADRPQAVQN